MANPTQTAITQALNIQETGIFRLLVLTTALLVWVLAMGVASASLLQNLHSRWQLEKSASLTIYLPPETDPAAIQSFMETLPTLSGVGAGTITPPAEVQAQLQTHLQGLPVSTTQLPLPTVLTIPFNTAKTATMLTQHVLATFPAAEVDTHAGLLQTVGRTVRTLQIAAAAVGAAMLGLIMLLIATTTRTGLMAEGATLQLLIQLGAADATLTRTLATQVFLRALGGYAAGLATAACMLFAAMQANGTVGKLTSASTLAFMVGIPLLLPMLAAATAALTAHHLIRTQTL